MLGIAAFIVNLKVTQLVGTSDQNPYTAFWYSAKGSLNVASSACRCASARALLLFQGLHRLGP